MGNTSSASQRFKSDSAPPPYSTGDFKGYPRFNGSSLAGADVKEANRSVDSLVEDEPDEALHMLKDYDVTFIVDDSSSMKADRWNRTRRALSDLVDSVNKYTGDGVDVVFLNSKTEGRKLKISEAVTALFDTVQPTYGTPIGKRLDELLTAYTLQLQESRKPVRRSFFKNLPSPTKVRPVNYLIITDGDASDDPLDVIVRNAKWLDENTFPLSQVGIQFVQIGHSRKAKTFLKKLDDDLSTEHGVRDMVDTFPYDKLKNELNCAVLKNILLGGINRKEDRAH